jgi:hypothetical protein
MLNTTVDAQEKNLKKFTVKVNRIMGFKFEAATSVTAPYRKR